MDLTYLASPYTHPDPEVMQERFEFACLATGLLLKRGIMVFSPIVHCHPVAMKVELPQDFDWWENYDRRMIRGCETFTVLRMPGWDASKGVKAETEYAKSLGMPMFQSRLLEGKTILTWEPIWT